jgi:hypothetical protein
MVNSGELIGSTEYLTLCYEVSYKPISLQPGSPVLRVSNYFSFVAQQPCWGLGRHLIVEVSRSHSDAPHSVGLGRRIGLSQRPLPDNMRHSQEAEFHVHGAIQSRNPRKRATEDRCVRERVLSINRYCIYHRRLHASWPAIVVLYWTWCQKRYLVRD